MILFTCGLCIRTQDVDVSGFDGETMVHEEETTVHENEEETMEHQNEQEAIESRENSSVEGDDCEVIVEDMAGYKESEPVLQSDDNEFIDVPIREEDHFREAGCEDGNEYHEGDDDSGDDVWNDDHIPDPLSDDDRQDVEEKRRQFNYGDDEILALGKTFNNAEEFKYVVLKYSLKTQYDIKFYKSSADRLGARCTQHEKEKCGWRVYCSFERGRNKLMVKVFMNTHICVRSGYTRLLKCGTIAQLFEERL